jgi:hypothetical protein
MFKLVKGWIEHRTNPQHVLCRFLDLLRWYDGKWCRLFNGKPMTKKKIYEVIAGAKKR